MLLKGGGTVNRQHLPGWPVSPRKTESNPDQFLVQLGSPASVWWNLSSEQSCCEFPASVLFWFLLLQRNSLGAENSSNAPRTVAAAGGS